MRVLTGDNRAEHIAPMRPPCQDGVIVANGHAYWGPWMCGCQLSLYGHIALAPADDPAADAAPGLWTQTATTDLPELDLRPHDWTSYRANNARSDETDAQVPRQVTLAWEAKVSGDQLPTAPVAAGGLVFVADRSGRVTAWDEAGHKVWTAYTSGAIYYPPAIQDHRLFVGAADGRVYAFAARTGEALWSFRVAPRDRWIPIYDKLISRWPVSGGVVVQGDTVYAAAGIAHYDGTFVVALDATSGQLKAQNLTSGKLSEEVNGGISLQGNLAIVDDQLQFLAGGVYETARYDLQTLECLNAPKAQVTSQFHTAFYALYPEYGKYVSLDHTRADRTSLVHDASYEGSVFTNLALYGPLPEGVPTEPKDAARWARRNGSIKRSVLWQDQSNRRFTSFVVSDPILLAAGHEEGAEDQPFLVAIDINQGKDLWRQPLPSLVVKGGVAITANGRIYCRDGKRHRRLLPSARQLTIFWISPPGQRLAIASGWSTIAGRAR